MLVKVDAARKFLIDELDVPLASRCYAVLAYDGVKRSSLFRYEGKYNLNDKFRELGIEGNVCCYGLGHSNAFIARDRCDADIAESMMSMLIRLTSIRMAERGELWQEEFADVSYNLGVVLGYPESAVEFYVREFVKGMNSHISALEDSFYNQKKERPNLKCFMPFVTSIDNYEDEKQVALRWEEHIIKNYPCMYYDLFFG